MNSIPTVYISKEIIQRNDNNTYTIQQKELHLSKSLMKPTDKLSEDSKHMLGYSSRFIEDYLFHKAWKIFNQMNVIGFTVNPEYCSGNYYYAYFIYIYIYRFK